MCPLAFGSHGWLVTREVWSQERGWSCLGSEGRRWSESVQELALIFYLGIKWGLWKVTGKSILVTFYPWELPDRKRGDTKGSCVKWTVGCNWEHSEADRAGMNTAERYSSMEGEMRGHAGSQQRTSRGPRSGRADLWVSATCCTITSYNSTREIRPFTLLESDPCQPCPWRHWKQLAVSLGRTWQVKTQTLLSFFITGFQCTVRRLGNLNGMREILILVCWTGVSYTWKGLEKH